jgi:hypothetical protein
VGFDELRSLATVGKLTRRDKVWRKGMSGWRSADKIDGLFENLPPDLEDEPPRKPNEMSPCNTPAVGESVPLGSLLFWLTELRNLSRRTVTELGRLSGRTFILLVILGSMMTILVMRNISEARERQEWERERPRREAERVAAGLRQWKAIGFESGKHAAQAARVTGLGRLARSTSEIEFLAGESIRKWDPNFTGAGRAEWITGFVEGYVDYMRRLNERLAPAY